MILTTATNKKVRELLKAVRDGSLVPRPEFQRRLVWTMKDKERFVETVIRGYPFPEIYICNGEVNTETGEGTQLLVDGLQRVSTLYEYFSDSWGVPSLLVPKYADLSKEEKEVFLEYYVVVRDLGSISKEQVIEVFRRLNSTQYTLRDMEVNNAIYNGALKRFCETLAEHAFFEDRKLFSVTDRKRMGDVAFCLTLVATLMIGYFNRDDEHEAFLARFNEAFPEEERYRSEMEQTLQFIDECGFSQRSRIWKKADFLSAFVEIHRLLVFDGLRLSPTLTLERLEGFYSVVERNGVDLLASVYSRAALQASNDRNNRIRRGVIIGGLLVGMDEEFIINELLSNGLISSSTMRGIFD